ncbi:MAG TPA: hypothetical protein VEK57_19360 [Thermoanaerobaculia bacterium]|nr:hypothetical protein [Thermoanaerobaculia bacterium]
MTRTISLLALLLSLSFPLHAIVIAGAESAVTNAPLDLAGFDQNHGRIATNGSEFFAVWKDGSEEVHGTAISPLGERLFPAPLRIATGASLDDAPAIDAGGGGYLVAWSTHSPGGAPGRMQARMVFANSPMGTMLDLGESDQRGRPRIAFNGTNFLVMWLAPDLRLRGAVVRFNGELVRTFQIATAELTYPDIPLVASGNTFYFAIGRIDVSAPVTGEGNPAAVHLVSVGEDGTVGAPVVLSPASTPTYNLRADERGGNIVVAWSSAFFSANGTISSVRTTSAGAGPVETFPTGLLRLHDVIADSFAAGFLLVYGNETERRARYAGSTAESTLAVPLPPMTIDDAAGNGERMLLLARAIPPAGSSAPLANDLYLQRLDTPALEPLSLAPRHQTAPDIAAAGDVRLAVWSEHRGAERRMTFMATRIDAAGRTLDPDGIDLGMTMNQVLSPRVASNGTGWLVAWWENKKVYGMRIARDGTRLDPAPFLIADDAFGDAAVSWDGQQYVVVFTRGIFLRGLQVRVIATRVLPSGAVQGPEIPLNQTGAHEAVAIASSPANGSLVVWRTDLRVNAALLSTGGTPATVELPNLFAISPRPAVAWNSGTFLVAAPHTGPFGTEARWYLVSPTGVVQTPLSAWPALRTSGTGWPALELEPFEEGFLLYTADRGATASAETELSVTRISSQGVLTEGPQVIAGTVGDFRSPLGASGAAVVYARNIGHPVRGITRVFVRTLTNAARSPKRRAVR